jgi:peptide/nickel transport system substrate-binding protein
MRKRFWFGAPASLTAVVALAAVLAVTASGGPTKSAGSTQRGATTNTLNLAVAASDVDYTDPGLAYGVLSWQIEYETCANLVTYSDAGGGNTTEISPGAAAGLPVVSSDGKTYTFTIKPGIRFNDGATVTAASFAAAINRDSNPAMVSPVVAFIGNIVGEAAVANKKASTVSGVVAKGNKLTIKLTAPDGGLLDKLAMPFFCAIEPAKTPVDPKGVNTLPGAGPYYIASRTVGKQIVLKVNPYYKGDRPHRSQVIVMTMNTNPQQTFLQVSNGTYAADPSGLDSPTAAADLAKQFGINKSRFFVHPTPETDYVALNTQRAFQSASLRQAVNYAIDRPALLRVRGYLPGKRTVQILPPSLTGGLFGKKLYPIAGADPTKAAALAAGHCGNVNLWYATGPTGTPQAGILKYNLGKMGCNVTTKAYVGYAIYTAAGVKGTDMDAMIAGWYQDYADGYDFFHILLDGRTIQAANNNNLAYFNNPTVNAKIDAADRLVGAARAKAWGSLDISTMTNYAPWAPIDNRAVRDFIGPHTAGYQYTPAFGSMDLGTLYLK